MNRFADSVGPVVIRLGAALLLLVTWVLPAWSKLSGGGVPPFFVERFQNSFLASFPGLAASFWSIAILEALAALLALISLVTLEFLPGKRMPFLKLGVLLSILVFIQLGFGLRLIGDNDGGFNLFVYAVGAFLLYAVLDRADTTARIEAESEARQLA